MRLVPKALVLSLLLSVFITQCENETLVNIPDDAFLSALIELGVDKDGDGKICACEASGVTYLDVSGKGISNMSGIEAFYSLDTLICALGPGETEPTNLRILNVSQNRKLIYLNCSSGQLTSLDVSNNTALETLICFGNQLSSLDVSHNTQLTWLLCGNNLLTSLHLSQNQALEELGCGANGLTSLDVSNNTALLELFIRNMPTLEAVCVWETPFPPLGVGVDTEGSPNVYFTTGCSQ